MKNATISFFAVITFSLSAQIRDTTYWNKNFEAGLNVNQTNFSAEWKIAQGGLSSGAVAGFLNAKSEYVKKRSRLVNDFQSQYGLFTNEQIYNYNLRKNIDRLFFDNIYSYGLSKDWSMFASATFQTQFTAGYTYVKYQNSNSLPTDIDKSKALPDSLERRVSNFLAPGYLDEGVGLMWTPTTYFSARFAPIAFRQTFMTDDIVFNNTKKEEVKKDGTKDTVSFGVKKGTKVRNQFGLNALVKFDKDLYSNLNLKILGQYFSGYENLMVGVVRFDAVITAKVTKYINVNLTGVVMYNEDQIKYVQANEQLALGIVYKVTNIPVK
ncbi:MAG: DUF3078 domain-containing protein [Bacteroidota bacterium]|nr:DUF3078 domain-containing protein [Bacteroidota bacterium]